MSKVHSLKEFVKFDQSYLPKVDVVTVQQDENCRIMDIQISNNSGGRIECFLVSPIQRGQYPGIHFIHWLEPKASDSNRIQFLPYAKELAAEGYISILPDCFWAVDNVEYKKNPQYYRDRWWKTEFTHDANLIKQQLVDLISVHKVLKSQTNVESNRLGMVGHDFGAMTGSLLPSLGYDYNVYCLIAFTGRFSDWFRFGSSIPQENPQLFKEYVNKMDFLDPINALKNLGPNPVLMQFATEDFYVPEQMALKLHRSSHHETHIRWYIADHGMNHKTFEEMKLWILKNL